MTAPVPGVQSCSFVFGDSIKSKIERAIDETLTLLPQPGALNPEQRRGVIARYAAVLEGNFIYWMTGAYLSVRTQASREIIVDNLQEEIRDCHPGMMHRFAAAAHASATEPDFQAVYPDLMRVRLFVGRMVPVRLLVMMAYFEGFIQRFMAFLEELAVLQGSSEHEYTQVHGVCDVAHTDGLIRALMTEMEIEPAVSEPDLFEGVELLRGLIRTMVHCDSEAHLTA